ncbi:MAG: hypothetical protein PHS19_04330 [Eubacteriales bacterium]|nr:hypothetical protein [Eubacteriales bacterium]
MTSIQDDKKNEIPITMNGIEVMNYLSLDEQKLCFLAKEGYLAPYAGQHPSWFKLLIGSPDELKRRLPNWLYLKSSVESFKLNNKKYLKGVHQQKAIASTELLKPCKEDQLDEQGTYKKTKREDVKEYIDNCLANKISKAIIAIELQNKYNLSYGEIARLLHNEGLNPQQYDALKKRGERLCKKGKKLIDAERKNKKK